jgi:hypothetical protein
MFPPSKTWVCGRSLDGTAGSNTAGGMDICVLWVLCVVRHRHLWPADHSPKRVLRTVRCVILCDQMQQEPTVPKISRQTEIRLRQNERERNIMNVYIEMKSITRGFKQGLLWNRWFHKILDHFRHLRNYRVLKKQYSLWLTAFIKFLDHWLNYETARLITSILVTIWRLKFT